jgi:hypothetical protein
MYWIEETSLLHFVWRDKHWMAYALSKHAPRALRNLRKHGICFAVAKSGSSFEKFPRELLIRGDPMSTE